jgi:hypothetical protein
MRGTTDFRFRKFGFVLAVTAFMLSVLATAALAMRVIPAV